MMLPAFRLDDAETGSERAAINTLIETAGDLVAMLAARDPKSWLIAPLLSAEDFLEGFEGLQVLYGLPGASSEERYTFLGQMYFWERYIEALEEALDELPSDSLGSVVEVATKAIDRFRRPTL